MTAARHATVVRSVGPAAARAARASIAEAALPASVSGAAVAVGRGPGVLVLARARPRCARAPCPTVQRMEGGSPVPAAAGGEVAGGAVREEPAKKEEEPAKEEEPLTAETLAGGEAHAGADVNPGTVEAPKTCWVVSGAAPGWAPPAGEAVPGPEVEYAGSGQLACRPRGAAGPGASRQPTC